MTHYTDQFNSASPETCSRQSGTRIFARNAWKLAWNASAWVLLAAGSMLGGGGEAATENAPSLAEFQTGPGNDVVAVWRFTKSRSWWDISDGSQHASQVGWRLANSRFVHKFGSIYNIILRAEQQAWRPSGTAKRARRRCPVSCCDTCHDLRALTAFRCFPDRWTVTNAFLVWEFNKDRPALPWQPIYAKLGTKLTVIRFDQDFRPLNIGLVSAWQRAQDLERWKRTVETATLQAGAHSWWWR